MNYNKTTELSEEEQVNWLRLLRSTNVGPKTFFKILSIFSSSALALENISDFLDNLSTTQIDRDRPIFDQNSNSYRMQ